VVQTVQPVPPARATAPAAIEIRGLTLAYGRQVVLSRASFEVPAGGLAALVGPTGAGKTSLLHCLMGRLEPRAGEVRVLGGEPRDAERRVAYVPGGDQVDWGFPISLAEIVVLSRRGLLARTGAIDRAGALEWLERLGLRALAERRIGRLDPKQRRRALLARALAQDPELLLVDEPGILAEPMAANDFFEALELCRAGGRTVLVATRELAEAAQRYDRLALLNGGVVAHGRPAEVLTLENLRATYGDSTVAVRVPATSFATDR
jgi:ABC-type Mn2+/Zn2+ transport system ATPase subunit